MSLTRIGRPRQVEDEAVFTAMTHVLLRVSWPRLTLAHVAREVGVTPAALRQRFGSKHALLVAFYAWGTLRLHDSLVAATSSVASSTISSLTTLSTLVLSWVDVFVTPEAVANGLAAYPEVNRDPKLRRLARERSELVQRHFQTLLEAAHARGELCGGDAERIAWHLQASLLGVFMLWSIAADGDLRDRVQESLDLWLAPHRLPPAEADGAAVSARA
jgi:AcrR family transcriptional regulator